MAAASAWGQLCATIYYFSNQEIRVKLASNTAGFRSGPRQKAERLLSISTVAPLTVVTVLVWRVVVLHCLRRVVVVVVVPVAGGSTRLLCARKDA
jgi:hypothetical protein